MVILEEPIKTIMNIKNYIGGEWIDSQGEFVDVVNPAKSIDAHFLLENAE